MYMVIKCDHKYTQCHIQFPVIEYDWGVKREARKTVEQRSGRWYKSEWHVWMRWAEVRISLEQITFRIHVHVLWACEGHDLLREYGHRYAETGVPSSHWVRIWGCSELSNMALGSIYELGVEEASECSKLMNSVFISVRKVLKINSGN